LKKKKDEVTVKVQSMFPNCQKYELKKKKIKKIHNYKEMIKDMEEAFDL
jgi:hypothetical protein